ncbi:MAG: hypothetical protein D6732_04550 [Methanobacteriota archaeon]|nr:MAG: hypothetical protein D6732_04550 [Euryarchaeota archaeon]
MFSGNWILARFLLLGLFSFFAGNSRSLLNSGHDVANLVLQSRKCSVLFVIMEDRSGSTNDFRKLSIDDYRFLAENFLKKFWGVVAVRAIGNPSPEERNFYRFKVPKPIPHEKAPKDATYTEKAKVIKRNEEIDEENEHRLAEARQRMEEWLKWVEKGIVHYQPNGKDITDIRDALIHLDRLISEPTFRKYDHVIVLLLSDGLHDADGKPVKGLFHPERKVMLNLIGWKNTDVFDSSGPYELLQFESVDGFLDWWEEFECD